VPKATATELAQGKIPEELQEKRVPLLVTGQPESLVLWARVRLKASAVYSIIALGAGIVATFQTTAEEMPLLSRLGPSHVHQGDWVPYCLPPENEFHATASPPELEWPEGGAVEYRLGLGSSKIASRRCVEFHVSSTASLVMPPVQFLGGEVEPEVLSVESGEPLPRDGQTETIRASPWGAIEVSEEADFSALRIQDDDGQTREVVAEAGRARLGGARPQATCVVDYIISDKLGRREGQEQLLLGSGAPHFVISEVFADPHGAEPEGEWVELMNVGNVAGSLVGYTLASDHSEWSLPDATLEPGAFGLVVRDDFSLDPELDEIPDATAVRVPAGNLTLKNSGVPLSLLTPDRVQVADFPAFPGKSGVSVARLDPLLEGSSVLGLHEEPGSSPGGANRLRTE